MEGKFQRRAMLLLDQRAEAALRSPYSPWWKSMRFNCQEAPFPGTDMLALVWGSPGECFWKGLETEVRRACAGGGKALGLLYVPGGPRVLKACGNSHAERGPEGEVEYDPFLLGPWMRLGEYEGSWEGDVWTLALKDPEQ